MTNRVKKEICFWKKYFCSSKNRTVTKPYVSFHCEWLLWSDCQEGGRAGEKVCSCIGEFWMLDLNCQNKIFFIFILFYISPLLCTPHIQISLYLVNQRDASAWTTSKYFVSHGLKNAQFAYILIKDIFHTLYTVGGGPLQNFSLAFSPQVVHCSLLSLLLLLLLKLYVTQSLWLPLILRNKFKTPNIFYSFVHEKQFQIEQYVF